MADDKENFKPIEDFNFVNAGTYEVYYKLSAKGYNSYVSNESLELIIQPRDAEVLLNAKYVKSSGKYFCYFTTDSHFSQHRPK